MERYKPLVDKLYRIIAILIAALLAALTIFVCIFPTVAAVIITVLVDLFAAYFFISPLFGYVELREDSLYIKYGFILKKEIPYSKIRGAAKARGLYSDSMISLKSSLEHVNIKYNAYDVTTVSVVDNDAFVLRLEEKIAGVTV